MDWFTTALVVANITVPNDRPIDGINLLPALVNNTIVDRLVVIITVGLVILYRTIFYYRGDEMMAVRNGLYKAHYWTWTNSIEEFNRVWLHTILKMLCCSLM